MLPWLPAILWAIVIYWASTDTFSAEHTASFVLLALRQLFPDASAERLQHLHLFVRKTAHFTEYFVFGLLLIRAIRGARHGWQARWMILALGLAAAYAGFDELHQSFVRSRTASPWDSLLDTAGAAAGQFVLWLWVWLRTRNIPNRADDGRDARQSL